MIRNSYNACTEECHPESRAYQHVRLFQHTTGLSTSWSFFVDDTTASEIVHKGDVSNAQSITDQVILWSQENRRHLNPNKCKGFRILFARNPEEFHAVVVEGKELDVVSSAKPLGLTISNNLKWNAHVDDLIKKASKRLYF